MVFAQFEQCLRKVQHGRFHRPAPEDPAISPSFPGVQRPCVHSSKYVLSIYTNACVSRSYPYIYIYISIYLCVQVCVRVYVSIRVCVCV